MSTFDDASLVFIPSGYKNQKLYSVKPLSGDGDLTFSRASSATRVASDGLIEKVRTNLTFYSEQFDNAFWFKLGTGLTVTANTTIAPNGTLTADTLNVSNNDNVLYGSRAIALDGNEFTFSIYAKGTGTFSMNIRLNSATTTTQTKTLTSEWQRFQVTVTNTVAVTSVEFFLNLNTSSTYNIWGAQVEQGVMTDYIATTSAAVSVGPVSGLPRLDYLNSTCPRLILEPQRSNLALYSEQMTVWTNGAASVTANATISPDGYQNADSVNNTSDVSTFVAAANGVYTWSLFVKQGTSASASIDMSDGATGDVVTTFNFTTKTFSATSAGGSWTSPSTAYQDYGNGWYRISLTATKNAGSTIGHKINASGSGYTYVWGAQLEAGAYATSYIPTLGTSVTRVADVCSKSGISSLIGQANGTAQMTFVMDSDTSADSTTMLGIHAGTSTANRIQLLSRFGAVRLLVIANNSIVTNAQLYDAAPNEVVNVAFKYGSSGVTAYVNGTQVYTTASAVVFTETMELFTIGNRSGIDEYGKGQRVSQALVFPTALSNSDLAALTA